ncbi:hypothetical protein SUGI_0519030 [Cryptomeria japonica]|nr:hypothetical protein SUGI_0519030 [Cryptomeria japonica]
MQGLKVRTLTDTVRNYDDGMDVRTSELKDFLLVKIGRESSGFTVMEQRRPLILADCGKLGIYCDDGAEKTANLAKNRSAKISIFCDGAEKSGKLGIYCDRAGKTVDLAKCFSSYCDGKNPEV